MVSMPSVCDSPTPAARSSRVSCLFYHFNDGRKKHDNRVAMWCETSGRGLLSIVGSFAHNRNKKRNTDQRKKVVSTQTITLQVPDELYARLRHRAAQSHRSVEAELVNVLAEAVPGGDELGPDLAESAAALAHFDDDELWAVARGRFPDDISCELQALHDKQQQSALAKHESERSDELCLQYERFMLMRARAALLLKERGRDVSSLLDGS